MKVYVVMGGYYDETAADISTSVEVFATKDDAELYGKKLMGYGYSYDYYDVLEKELR